MDEAMEQPDYSNVSHNHASSFPRWRVARYFHFVCKKWWVVALSIAFCCGIGAAYNKWWPVTYVSTAHMWITGVVKLAESAVYEDRNHAQFVGATEVQLLQSDMMQNRALDDLRVAGVFIPVDSAGDPRRAKIRVTQIAKTSVLEITARSPSPTFVQAILNTTMDELIAYVGEIHDGQNAATYKSLKSQITAKEDDLKVKQDSLANYMRTNDMPVLENEAKAANTYLTELLIERARLETEYARTATDSQAGQSEQVMRAVKTLKQKMASVQQSIQESEAKVKVTTEAIAEFERIKIEVDRARAFYDHLVTLLQNVDLSQNLPWESVSVLDRASVAKSAKLSSRLILALTGILGIFVGLGIVYLLELKNDTVTSVDFLSSHFSEPVVGTIPEMRDGHRQTPMQLLESEDKQYLFAESYRGIRSFLLFGTDSGKHPSILLVTSAVPKEGKSSVAANVARALALGGRRVVLIDGDLRRGNLHQLFNLPEGPGFADFLGGHDTLERYLVSTSVKGLDFLPRGRAKSSVGELLLTPAFSQLVTEARRVYDFAIIDSPPVLAADDAANMASKADGTIFVVRDSYTRTALVRRAILALYKRGVGNLGLVLNRARGSQDCSYYAYPQYYSAMDTEPSEEATIGSIRA